MSHNLKAGRYIGVDCKRHHGGERYINGGGCVRCTNDARYVAYRTKPRPSRATSPNPNWFTPREDRHLTELHSRGLTSLEIAAIMARLGFKKRTAQGVANRLRRLRNGSPTGDGEMGRRLSPMSDVSSRNFTPAGAAPAAAAGVPFGSAAE